MSFNPQYIQSGFFIALGLLVAFRQYIPGWYASIKAKVSGSFASGGDLTAETAVEAVFTLSRYLATEKDHPEYKQVVAMLKTLEPLIRETT